MDNNKNKFNKMVITKYLKYTIFFLLVLMSLTYLLRFYRLALAELIILALMMICLFICTGYNLEFKKILYLVLVILCFDTMINGFVHNNLKEVITFGLFTLFDIIMLYIVNKDKKD